MAASPIQVVVHNGGAGEKPSRPLKTFTWSYKKISV